MENNPSNVSKLTVLRSKHKPFLSPNQSSMRIKKKQSSNQTTPPAHETIHDQTTMVSPYTRPYSSGANQRESLNTTEDENTHTVDKESTSDQQELEHSKRTEYPFMTEETKAAMKEPDSYLQYETRSIASIPSYNFESSEDEQAIKIPTSRDEDIIKHERIIEDMEQTIDQNTTMINRLSKKIKSLEDKADATYNHPDITSKDREAKMKVRNDQKDILSSLATIDDAMAKLIKANDIAYDKIR